MKTYDAHLPPILGALLVAFAPHAVELPYWVTLWCLLLWGYVLLAVKNQWALPSRPVRVLLALFGFGGALIAFGGAFYSEAYVGLLAIMAGLKPLETRSYRDKMITLFLAYFTIISNLFYSDTLVITLYLFLSVLITTTVLIHIHHPAGALKAKFRLAGVIILQAIPIMILLFVLFPRVQGSFLGLTRQTGGRSGFSNRMTPGSVSAIVNDNAIAFRARFNGPVPEPEKRYWRGIVFLFFDGRGWRRGMPVPARPTLTEPGRPVSYTITLEPHKERWLFVLEMPGTVPAGIVPLTDYTLISRHPVNDRKMYSLTSYGVYGTGPLRQREKLALILPGGGNPRARALAASWAAQANAPEDIVASALKFFRDQPFVYTLRPPLLGHDPVDDFLFSTRKGYCEHYASAFTYLMRAAGIPARVIGGYLGGEVNPYGDYLIVRQSDAHAWSEVWLPGKGWTRADPTAVVAPERLTGRPEDALSPEDLTGLLGLPELGPISDYLRTIRFGWDAVNTYWTLWVMGYSFQEQSSLLSRIGVSTDSWKWIIQAVLLILGGIGLLTFLIVLRLYRRSAPRQDPIRKCYDLFCRKLARADLPRASAQGPLDYADMVIRRREDLRAEVMKITDLYVRLRYGPGGDKSVFRQFRSLVRKFDPRHKKGGAKR